VAGDNAGAARALVLLGSAMQLAGCGLVSFLVLVFGPVLRHKSGVTGPIVLAVVLFVVISLVGIVLANLVALRAASTRRVALGGCGILLIGFVAGIGVLLTLVTVN
jgi:CBS domain containing-hemolysin-like protein